MPIAPESIMQMTWKFRTFGQTVRHVRAWRLKDGGGGAGGIEHSDAFIQAVKKLGPADWTSSLLGCISSDNNLIQYRAQVIGPVRHAYSYQDLAAGTFGARGIAVSANLQGSIEASTRYAGRSQVACYKIGTLATEDLLNGYFKPALVVQFLAYAATFTLPVTLAGATPSVWIPCIVHKHKKPNPPTYDDIYEASPTDTIRVKNTRTVNRGE